MRVLLWSAGGVLALGAACVGALVLFATPEMPAAALAAKYGEPPSRFLTLPSGTVAHFRDYPAASADRAAPILVLLHGSNASLHTWEPWAQRLKSTMRVVSVDMPGHGLTGATVEGDYGQEGMVGFVDAFLRALAIDRPVVLAGSSMGGHVAWRFTLAHPERVARLVLVDAAGVNLPGAEPTPPLAFRLARNPLTAPLLRYVAPRALFAAGLEKAFYEKSLVTPAMIDRYWELNRRVGTADASLARFRLPLYDPAMMARLKEIAVPTLVLWGREDGLLPVGLAEVYRAAIPQAKVIIYENCGHLPMEEVAERSAADLRAFVERTPPAAADKRT